MTLIELARKLRPIIEQAAASLDDKTASDATSLFPTMKLDGSLIKAGTRIRWQGRIKKANVDLWDTPENAPDKAPTLWAEINYRNGIRIIPALITSPEAFAYGELGWEGDTIYRSLRDGNTFPPSVTPEWWEVVVE